MKTQYLYGLLFIFISTFANGTNYYISNSGNDSNDGRSPDRAWKTFKIIKSKTHLFNGGDSILLRRGDVFKGGVTNFTDWSGEENKYIYFGAYGSGNMPVISGLETLSGWQLHAPGIYKTPANCKPWVNLLIIDGEMQTVGRYPNEGWLRHESSTVNSITDNDLSTSVNWIGSEIVIKNNNWTISRNPVTGQVNKTINFNNTTGNKYVPRIGEDYGFFFQRKLETLDRFGEWYYDGTNMFVYFGNSNPNNHTVKTSVVDTLFHSYVSGFFQFENLKFEGSNIVSMELFAFEPCNVVNCDFEFAGTDALRIHGYTYAASRKLWSNVSQNRISEIQGTPIFIGRVGDFYHAKVDNNYVQNTGLKAGMGPIDGTFTGIYNRCINGITEFNTVINSGYNGISIHRDTAIARYNYISNANQLITDGAGIYTWQQDNDTTAKQKAYIYNNIIIGGGANGIYSDDNSNGVEIYNNTAAYLTDGFGIYNNNPRKNKWHNNVLVDNLDYGIGIHVISTTIKPYGNSSKQNIIVSENNCFPMYIYDDFDSKVLKFGTTDSNYYISRTSSVTDFKVRTNNPWKITNYSFENWKALNYDKNSAWMKYDDNDIFFSYNISKVNKWVTLPFKEMKDVKGTVYRDSLLLSPFSSVVLLKVSERNMNRTLSTGWNYFSMMLEPDIYNPENYFSELIGTNKLLKVQNDEGRTFEPNSTQTGWINTIGSLTIFRGYKIKVTENCSFTEKGYTITLPLTVTLKKGWNLVPYFGRNSIDASVFFDELIQSGLLAKVQDEKGNTIENWGLFGGWKNSIGSLEPGKSYEIKVNNPATLTFE